MTTFNVKIQKADGSTEDLIVESKSPLNAKNFLRRCRLKPIEVQISKSNTSSRTETRECDYIATCELKNGTRTTVEIAAISEIAARRELRRRGKRVLKLEPARKQNNSTKIAEKTITTSILSEPKTKTVIAQKKGSALQSIEQLFERPPGVKEKAIWASKLSALVDAGVPIVRGLDLMATQQKLPLFQRALSELSAEVNQGVAMGTAMRANSKVFDQLTIAMVEAGEAGGSERRDGQHHICCGIFLLDSRLFPGRVPACVLQYRLTVFSTTNEAGARRSRHPARRSRAPHPSGSR